MKGGDQPGAGNPLLRMPPWAIEMLTTRLCETDFGPIRAKETHLARERLDGYFNLTDEQKPVMSVRIEPVKWLPVIDDWPELDIQKRTLVALQEGFRGDNALVKFEESYRRGRDWQQEFIQGSRSLWWHEVTEVQLYQRRSTT